MSKINCENQESLLVNDYLIQKAKFVALFYHKNQVRKFTGEKYFVHCEGVANIISSTEKIWALEYNTFVNLICSAYLHDTIEDTQVTYDFLQKEFNTEIAELVQMVTKVTNKEDGKRDFRQTIECWHLSKANTLGKILKLADICNNLSNLEEEDFKANGNLIYSYKYFSEKNNALDYLLINKKTENCKDWDIKELHAELFTKAKTIIDAFFEKRNRY